MATLVLNNDSISVNLESDHLIIRQHNIDGDFQTLPVKDLERVIVIGKPAITFPVLARLMDRHIPCSFLSKGERLRGSLDTGSYRNVARRMVQYDKLREDGECRVLACGVIEAKLRNARRVIQRACANRGVVFPHDDEHWQGLNASIDDLCHADDVEVVRGIEGVGSFHYFRFLSLFFPATMPFTVRSRQPPLDEANAVLSFCYTVLMNEVLSAVRLHSLDPGLGFLHKDRLIGPSLALDLMEPFRPSFADLLTINLLSHGRLNAERDFEHDQDSGGVYLAKEARGRVLSACETALSRRFVPLGKSEHTTLRLAIDEQVVCLVRHLEQGSPMEWFRLA